MSLIIRNIAIILLLLVNSIGFAQKRKRLNNDSLLNVVINTSIDSVKADALNNLAINLRPTEPDSSLFFAKQALKISNNNDIPLVLRAKIFNTLGNIYTNKSRYALSHTYYENSLNIYNELNNEKGIAKSNKNLGNVSYYKGNYSEAMKYYFNSLKINEKHNNIRAIAGDYNNIGMIYFKQKNYKKSEEYYKKAAILKKKLGNKKSLAYSYNNIGDLFLEQNKNDSALFYYNSAKKIREEIKDTRNLAYTLSSLGKFYSKLQNFNKAFEYYHKSIEIRRKLGDKEGIAGTLSLISEIYLSKSNFNQSIKYAKKSLSLADSINARPISKEAYKLLAVNYEKKNNKDLALKYYKKYWEANDSIFNDQKKKEVADLESQYQVDKAQQELEKQKLLVARKDAINKKQKVQNYATLGGLVLMIVLALVFYQNIKQKKRANQKLKAQNNEIEQQKEEINLQNEELSKQHDILVAQKDEITASIIYAKHIQEAILPTEFVLQKHYLDSFIFFKPRDIVSGDFYWIKNIRNHTVIAAADCTGHGVPGALMSMLGSSFLDEIVHTEDISSTGYVLDELRNKVKKTLNQEGKEGEAKDGMDIAFYVVNNDTLEMQFSGAYNSLYIIRDRKILNEEIEKWQENKNIVVKNQTEFNKTISESTKYLIEIKADRQPIAIYIQETNFITNTFQLEKNDVIYTFSDGYVDQFGGELGKKFKSKRFKNLFFEISEEKLSLQKQILGERLIAWHKGQEQIDDIIIIGVRV